MILSDPIFSFQMTLKLREQRLSITSAVNIELMEHTYPPLRTFQRISGKFTSSLRFRKYYFMIVRTGVLLH